VNLLRESGEFLPLDYCQYHLINIVKSSSTLPAYSEEQIKPFLNRLNKRETIQVIFAPKNLNTIISGTIGLILLILFLFFNALYSVFLSSWWFLLFRCVLVVPLILFIIKKNSIFVFTTEKLMRGNSKNLQVFTYEDIIAITCVNQRIDQFIEIHLKDPLPGVHEKEIKIFYFLSNFLHYSEVFTFLLNRFKDSIKRLYIVSIFIALKLLNQLWLFNSFSCNSSDF
jgi:hypothetical protein